MKVLVTGGAGFIGSNLVDALIDEGHDVVIIDNLSSGKRKNINPEAKFYEMDIRDKDVEEVFKKEKIDILNHHAAQIDVRHSVADPINDAEINIIGLLNLLQNAVKYGVKKVIAVSSGGVVYGEDAKLPIKEDEKKKPISPYGVSKLTSEHYLHFYSKTYGLRYSVLRYSNVYGLRQDPFGEAGVVSIFTNRMLSNKEPTIFGDGKQTRDYVYVKDVVDANLRCIEKGDSEAFNIGTGKEITVNQVFSEIKKATGYTGKAIYADSRPGELLRNCLDASKAKKILGWKPRYSFEESIKETVEWIRSEQE